MHMTQTLSQSANPASQEEFQQGRLDGSRYFGDGHDELLMKYHHGSSDYRMGWDSSTELARSMNPDFAS